MKKSAVYFQFMTATLPLSGTEMPEIDSMWIITLHLRLCKKKIPECSLCNKVLSNKEKRPTKLEG